MPRRRTETEAMIRQEPFAYRAAYDANSNVEYEGWAAPGSATSSAVWIVAKHTYDSNNRLTATQWAATSGSPAADFDQIWDNYNTTLSYV